MGQPTKIGGPFVTLQQDTDVYVGDVVGPSSATDNAVVRYDGTTGKLVQDSAVFVDDSGNLGVGTASPSVKEHVVISGSAPTIVDAATTVAVFQNSGAAGSIARLNITSGNTGQSIIQLGDNDDDDIGSIAYNQSTNAMSFRTNNVSDRMVIDSSGNVGIGITPNTIVQVKDSNAKMRFTNDTVDAGTMGLEFNHRATDPTTYIKTGIYSVSSGSAGRADLHFLTNNVVDTSNIASGTDTRMIITAAGNIGMGGTVAPSVNADLTLEGGALCMKETTTPTADTNYGKIYTKTDNKLYFQDGAGTEHEIAFV